MIPKTTARIPTMTPTGGNRTMNTRLRMPSTSAATPRPLRTTLAGGPSAGYWSHPAPDPGGPGGPGRIPPDSSGGRDVTARSTSRWAPKRNHGTPLHHRQATSAPLGAAPFEDGGPNTPVGELAQERDGFGYQLGQARGSRAGQAGLGPPRGRPPRHRPRRHRGRGAAGGWGGPPGGPRVPILAAWISWTASKVAPAGRARRPESRGEKPAPTPP